MRGQSTGISGGGYPDGTMPVPRRATTWTDNAGMMPRRLHLFLAVGLGLNRVIHTIGFLSAWGLAEIPRLGEPILATGSNRATRSRSISGCIPRDGSSTEATERQARVVETWTTGGDAPREPTWQYLLMSRSVHHPSIRRTLGAGLLAALLMVSACGGDDTASSDPTTTNDETAGGATSAAPSGTSGATTTGVSDEPTRGSLACHDLFSDEEVTELFREPAALEDEETLASIGQTVCTWGTIDDPDDTASQVLTVQVYSGDPVPGASFYDTSIYEEVREIDGIGEKAFAADLGGVTMAFLDGDVAGFVSYFAIAFGDTDQVEAGEDEVIEFLRKLHDRAT